MLNEDDVKAYMHKFFLDVEKLSIEGIELKTMDSLRWLYDNYEQMDTTGKAFVDKIERTLFEQAKRNIDSLEDSPHKRKAHRVYLKAVGKHFDASRLLKQLESTPNDSNEVAESAERLAIKGIQFILDVLSDIRERTTSEESKIISISLLYSCVDELFAALHLARHHFYIQSNSHLRTVLEILDKVELFNAHPEMIDIWKGNNYKIKNTHLSPSAIRKKLGKESYDKMYGFLSELGTHATFKTVQARTTIHKRTPKSSIHIFIAGTPYEHLQQWNYFSIILVANLLLTKSCSYGEKELDTDDAVEMLENLYTESLDFIKSDLINWAVNADLDVNEIVEYLTKIKENIGN